MATIEDRIKDIEEELRKTEYNKATEHHIGILKAKLAKLQAEASERHSGGGGGFAIPKAGDATIALVGFPSVGKSSLLNSLTGAESKVGSFAFTTLRVIPGTLDYKGAQIQILDLPGIIENAALGSGRGREVLSMVRAADLILIITDTDMKGIDRIILELEKVGIIVTRKKKNIAMKKANKGGIKIHKPKNVEIEDEEIKSVIKEFKITNADLYIRERVTMDDIIDFLSGNRVYAKMLVVVNKIDLPHDTRKLMREAAKYKNLIKVSAAVGTGVDDLKEYIYRELSLVRIYLRKKSGDVDFERPLVLTEGSKVREVCRRVSREMLRSFRYALLTRNSARVNDQKVGLDYHVQDEDIITIVSKN